MEMKIDTTITITSTAWTTKTTRENIQNLVNLPPPLHPLAQLPTQRLPPLPPLSLVLVLRVQQPAHARLEVLALVVVVVGGYRLHYVAEGRGPGGYCCWVGASIGSVSWSWC